MLKKSRRSFIRNNSGMAVMELIPTLFVYMLLINFSLGFFGIVHSGILHSIAARNYTFETMRHRPNLSYHRSGDDPNFNFTKLNHRVTGIVYDDASAGDGNWVAPARPLAFASSFGGTDKDGINLSSRAPAGQGAPGEKDKHNKDVRNLNEDVQNDSLEVKSIWIKATYGMCLNCLCGDTDCTIK